MEMEDQYGISDLRQFISRGAVVGAQQFPPYPHPAAALPPSADLFAPHHHHHRGLSPPAAATGASHQQQQQQQQQQYEMVVMSRNMSPAVAAADMLHLHTNTNNTATTSSGFHLLHNKDHHHHPHHHHPHHQFNSDSTTTTATATGANSGGFDGGDGGAARWPRQETLTLLEIRSRLDYKFKEANQKGPLWDEVARILSEEHGYQRTGKKCREKFENLYKYYKKTKEGKAGRQDGKHYRFFRQLEALYGEHHNSNNNHHHHHHDHDHDHHNPMTTTSDTHHQHITGNGPHLYANNPGNIIPTTKLGSSDNNHHRMVGPNANASLSNASASEYDTSSSDNDVGGGGSVEESGDESRKKRTGKRSWKVKIKEFIDHQMRKIMEKQEAWLEKMMKTLESRERERIEREEEWRKQEGERVEREHKFWATERAWIEARDSALMTALEKLTNTRETANNADRDRRCVLRGAVHGDEDQWLETEVTRLVQLRTSMESRFQQCGFSEEVLWEDIAAKMAYLGYDRSAIVYKEKWDNINKFFQGKDNNNLIIRDNNNNEGTKKRKENYEEVSNNNNNNNNNNNHHEGALYMNYQLSGFSNVNNNCEINEPRLQLNEGSSSSPSSHNSNANVNVNVNVNANASVAGGSVMNDSCLRFFLGGDAAEGGGLGWDSSFGMKLNNKGGNQCD